MSTKYSLNYNLTNWAGHLTLLLHPLIGAMGASIPYCIFSLPSLLHISAAIYSSSPIWACAQSLHEKYLCLCNYPLLVLCMFVNCIAIQFELHSKVNSTVYPWPNYFTVPTPKYLPFLSSTSAVSKNERAISPPFPSNRMNVRSIILFLLRCNVTMFSELCEAKAKWKCCNCTHVLYDFAMISGLSS